MENTIENAPTILELKDKVKHLESALYLAEQEKEDLILNFQNSTNILIERIKSMEEEVRGYRPQTAQIFGRKSMPGGMTSSDLQNSTLIFKKDESELLLCYNCNRQFPPEDLKKHTILCYRNVVKCRKCGEYMPKSISQEHTDKWRSPKTLKEAVISGEWDIVSKCFSHGIGVNTKFSDLYDYSLLHVFVSLSEKKILDYIKTGLQELEVNNQDIDGNTAIMLAAQEKKIDETIDILNLFKNKIDFSIKNNQEKTALRLAIESQSVEIVKILVEAGAAVNSEGDDLALAQKQQNMDIVSILLEKGANLRPISSQKRKLGIRPPKPPLS